MTSSEPAPGSVLPVPSSIRRSEYERDLRALQIELVKAQYWIRRTGERVLIIFEGRDTAGKGGTIKRFREHLNPRGAPHVALPTPNDRERTQYYFQRYVTHLPAAGEMVFFDRSWYNRAGVERVMGFCTRQETSMFLRQAPSLEAGLVEGGLRLVKLYLAINREVQAKRLAARAEDPLKSWKLSPIDASAPERWDDYTEAQNDMFYFTHTRESPWTVINANRKRVARLNAIRHVLHGLPYDDKDPTVAIAPDPDIVGAPGVIFPGLDGAT